jgi:hypothetical protein
MENKPVSSAGRAAALVSFGFGKRVAGGFARLTLITGFGKTFSSED